MHIERKKIVKITFNVCIFVFWISLPFDSFSAFSFSAISYIRCIKKQQIWERKNQRQQQIIEIKINRYNFYERCNFLKYIFIPFPLLWLWWILRNGFLCMNRRKEKACIKRSFSLAIWFSSAKVITQIESNKKNPQSIYKSHSHSSQSCEYLFVRIHQCIHFSICKFVFFFIFFAWNAISSLKFCTNKMYVFNNCYHCQW